MAPNAPIGRQIHDELYDAEHAVQKQVQHLHQGTRPVTKLRERQSKQDPEQNDSAACFR
jgi:hypothetical protein